MINLTAVEEKLVSLGAKDKHEVRYSIRYYLPSLNQYLYINKQSGNAASSLIVHPRFNASVEFLLEIEGVNTTGTFNHKASMRKFPKKLHTGKEPIPYGIPFGFDNSESLERFINALASVSPYYLRDQELEISEATENGEFGNLTPTDQLSLVKSRRGQGRFRNDLINLMAKCVVTGCSMVGVLKASHIKPWCDSSNQERLDKYNGLLLIPNLDTLFDAGLITFHSDGSIQISSFLKASDCTSLGVHDDCKLCVVYPENKKYLKYHREVIFQE